MKHNYYSLLCGLITLALPSVPASAGPIPISCAADFSSCGIQENVLGQFPSGFLAISGDVILTEADGVTVSDVFRIFNDVIDTGGGTGLGTTAFMYSADDSTPLPDPATYSANAVFILENPNGPTAFNGNGTEYFLGIPEPASLGMLALGLVGGGFLRKFRSRKQPCREPVGTWRCLSTK
jgi:hypothetical protein